MCSVWGSPATQFAYDLTSAASAACEELRVSRLAITKPQAMAELADLANGLESVIRKLRTLSPVVDYALGQGIEPRGCADDLNKLLLRVRNAELKGFPSGLRPMEKERPILITMIADVLDVLDMYGPLTSKQALKGELSLAMKVLDAIASDIAMGREQGTWP
jgi:hypothetical protein